MKISFTGILKITKGNHSVKAVDGVGVLSFCTSDDDALYLPKVF